MYPLSSASTALHPRVRWHHRSPTDPGRAPLHKGQQRRQKPAHLHYILCVRTVYAAADSSRCQVTTLIFYHSTSEPGSTTQRY